MFFQFLLFKKSQENQELEKKKNLQQQHLQLLDILPKDNKKKSSSSHNCRPQQLEILLSENEVDEILNSNDEEEIKLPERLPLEPNTKKFKKN